MREEKRELYREGTPENMKKGYTELVYGGSGVEVEKGVISASGGSGEGGEGGGGAVVVEGVYSYDEEQGYMTFDGDSVFNALNDGKDVILFFPFPETGNYYCKVSMWLISSSEEKFVWIQNPLDTDYNIELSLQDGDLVYFWFLNP